MNGTVRPATGTALADVNPCPLNVCCNVWGQCGMTDDFCTISKSETGAPGTSAPGKNGCRCSLSLSLSVTNQYAADCGVQV